MKVKLVVDRNFCAGEAFQEYDEGGGPPEQGQAGEDSRHGPRAMDGGLYREASLSTLSSDQISD
jgi:hypothetical protein